MSLNYILVLYLPLLIISDIVYNSQRFSDSFFKIIGFMLSGELLDTTIIIYVVKALGRNIIVLFKG